MNNIFKTKKRNLLVILTIVLSVLLFTTCNLGLGEAVDILPPEVSITYPNNTAIIKEEFIMQGTVEDDFRIENVTVSFTSKGIAEGSTAYHYSFLATVNTEAKTWSIEGLNKKGTPDGIGSPYPIKDGLYTVTALATDASGRGHSYSVDYTIDNTAPVVSMTTPGSDSVPENYGNVISIAGQVADANIEKLIFTAYSDANGTSKIASTTIENFGGAIINNEIGRFLATDNPFYTDVYGDIAGEQKVYYYTIQAFDKARFYNGSTSAEGNSSTEYYLAQDISSLSNPVDANTIHSIRTEAYYRTSATTIDDAKKALATDIENSLKNIYKPTSTDTPIAQYLSINQTLTSNNLKLATFSLSPNTPPTFSYGTVFSTATPPETSNISASSSLEVSLHPNLDGSGHELDQFSVFVKKLTSDAVPETDTIYQLYPLEVGTNKDSVESALESGVLTLTLPLLGVNLQTTSLPTNSTISDANNKHSAHEGTVVDLPTGSYIVEVVGSDFSGREYKNQDTDKYGFTILSPSTLPIFDVSATFPTVTILKPKPLTDPVLTVEGSVSTSLPLNQDEHGLKTLVWTLKESGTDNFTTGELNASIVDSDPFTTENYIKYNFSIPLNHSQFPGTVDRTKDYILTLKAIDKDDGFSTINRYITYDVESPVVSLTADVHPTDSTYTNKTLTLIVDAIDDRGISSASDENANLTTNYYTVNNGEKIYFAANALDKTETITHNFTSEEALSVSVTVQDTAGNEKTETITIDTIAPTFDSALISNPTSPDYEQTIDAGTPEEKINNWYGNKALTISATAKDILQDGKPGTVSRVEYSLSAEGETASEWVALTKGQAEWTGIITPSITSNYELTLRAIDESANVTVAESILFSVDKTSPKAPVSFLVNNEEIIESFISNAEKDIKVTINDFEDEGSGIKTLKLTKIGTKVIDGVEFILPEEDTNILDLTISKDTLKLANTGIVEFTFTDYVGNQTIYTPFSIIIDTDAPDVAITSPEAFSTVNGNVTIRGTTNDSYSTSTELQIKNTLDDWDTITTTTSRVWSHTINTVDYKTKSITLRAVAIDSAGNNGYSAEHSININQDEDRPVITITNASLNGMTEENAAKLSLINQLRGSITDDDGITSLQISRNSSDAYEMVNILPGGLWVYPSSDTLGDGTHNLYFKVTDTVGTVFTSALSTGELQSAPKITDGTNNFGYVDSTEKGTIVKVNVDTIPPEITSIEINNDEDFSESSWRSLSDNETIHAAFKLRITAKDQSGVASIEIKHEGTSIAVQDTIAAEGNYIATTDEIDSTVLPNGLVRLSIEVTDGSGSVYPQEQRQVLVDNIAPTLTAVTSHEYASVVTGDVILEGNATDGNNSSGIKSIYFAFPTTEGANSNNWLMPEEKDIIEDGDAVWKKVTLASNTWRIVFGSGGYPSLSSYVGEDGGIYAIETSNNSNIWRLPIVFRLEDNLGNIGYTEVPPVQNPTSGNNYFELHVDPNGNKPLVSVSYPKPTDGNTSIILGGAITIFGSATDNEVVESVYMQIDTDNDGTFDETTDVDQKYLASKGYTIETIDPEPKPDGSDPDSWWGFKVTGTTNWRQVINASDEFNDKTIRYRVRSVDLGGAVSDWSEPITIVIDEHVPTIGESESLTLVQYVTGSSGAINKDQGYEDGTWLTGMWYLTGSIEDGNDIAEISVDGDIRGDEDTVDSDNNKWFTKAEFDSDSKGYLMNIPLGTDDGELSFTITATKLTEGPTVTTNRTFVINRDNTAPTVSNNLQSRDADIDDTNRVQQTDKTYTFGSTVHEAGGGLSHIAFWFERNVAGDENDRIYNIMEDRIGDANRTDLVRTEPTHGDVGMIDGLPRLRLSSLVTRNSETTLTHDFIKNNKNVRVGGLVTIAGVDRAITAVNYTTGEISFTPSADTSYTSADIAYVMLVNNQGTIETMRDDGSIVNDDGDGMLEFLERQSSTYTWTASIDSRNIPDGPIEIHAVAYDLSGNSVAYNVAQSTVSNNAPAIAKVWLGTDLNANNAIESNEETEYSTLSNNKPVTNAVIDASGATLKKFTATGLTHVIPEIVGGNGDLHYTLKTDNHADINVDTAGNTTRIRIGDGAFENGEAVVARVNPIVLNVQDNMLLGTIPDTTTDAHQFNFTIWDSTEESIVGRAGSQSATLEVTMHIDVLDDVKPYTVVSPFYWTSEEDNSLYENSRENGHIELEALSDTSGLVAELIDEDPKVSGKVTIGGTAFDDKSLREVWAKITDFTFTTSLTGGEAPDTGMVKIAEYNPASGEWKSGSSSIDTGWYFTAENIMFGQDGHSIAWKLHWDSQKMTGVVGSDKTITVIARDASGNAALLTENGELGSATYNNPHYQVDVVPYISSISTEISRRKSTNARTALGNYIVKAGETGIIINGFNFVNTNSNILLGTESLANGAVWTENTITIQTTDISNSGEVTLLVNGIEALNNRNKDFVSIDSEDNVAYNMMPMANNDTLNDDVAFDVWEYETVAKQKYTDIMDLELRIQPTDGKVGLAFVDGYYFNMPGSIAETDSFVSQRPFELGRGSYWESALAFSPNGTPFGLSANQNKDVGQGSFFTLFARTHSDYNTSAVTNYGSENAYKKRILGTGTDKDTIRVQRLLSPVMAATGSTEPSATSNMYVAYYDTITKELRYQWGTYAKPYSFGGQVDYNIASPGITDADVSKYSVIAKLENGIDYISLDARTVKNKEVVVITWYDKKTNSLKMAYNNIDPKTDKEGDMDTDNDGTSDKDHWKYEEIDTNGSGAHNAVKIDADGGIHIAYHTSKGLDLKYAYVTLPITENGEITKNIVTVDSFGATGTQVRLDIARETKTDKFVPYISYYEGGLAKIAYQVQFGTEKGKPALSGVDNNKFNKNWEVSVIPTSSIVTNDSVNIGVHKDSDDVQKAIFAATNSTKITVDFANTASTRFTNPPQTSDIGGNGTINPVVAYINGSGNVEMAQKR